MKKVKVHIPFTDRVTGKFHGVNEVLEMSEERIAEIQAFSVNMIEVLPDAPKKRKK